MKSIELVKIQLYFFFFDGVWARALPAADLEALLVRPSLNTFDAAFDAFGEVCFLGAFVWDRALPAADFEDFPVDLLFNVFEALLAVLLLVTFLFAIFFSSTKNYRTDFTVQIVEKIK